MLERPERNRGERELPAQLEPPHVGLDEPRPAANGLGFRLQALSADREHVRRQIEANRFDSRSSGWNQNPARTAAHFEHRAASRQGRLDEEPDVGPVAIRNDVVVQIRDEVVLLVAASGVHPRSLARLRLRPEENGRVRLARAVSFGPALRPGGAGLLVAQGFDGIETGGPHGGDERADKAHDHKDARADRQQLE